MPARPGPTSQEGYPSSSSSPTSDPHQDLYNRRRYSDIESDADYGRRDTYASDSSNNGVNEPNFYDHNAYDPYRERPYFPPPVLCSFVSHYFAQHLKTTIQT